MRLSSAALRVGSALMAGLFLLALVVQRNDPDPLVWMLLYAVPAVLSLLAVLNRFSRFALAAAALYGVLAVVWSPDWSRVDAGMWQPDLQMMGNDVERARECIGLLLAAAWMGTLGWVALRRVRQRRRASGPGSRSGPGSDPGPGPAPFTPE